MPNERSLATRAGMERARALGRMPGRPRLVSDDAIRAVIHLPTSAAAASVGLCRQHYMVRRRAIEDGESNER